MRLLRRARATVLRRRGFAAAVRCPEGCSARLTVTRGRRAMLRDPSGALTRRSVRTRLR